MGCNVIFCVFMIENYVNVGFCCILCVNYLVIRFD